MPLAPPAAPAAVGNRRTVERELAPDRFFDFLRRPAIFFSQLTAGVAGPETLGDLLGGDSGPHDYGPAETHPRIQRDDPRLGGEQRGRSGGVQIVTDEREEANGQSVDVLIDALQMRFHQLSHGELTAPRRVYQRSRSLDEHRQAVRQHARGQQGMPTPERLLQVANRKSQLRRRHSVVPAEGPQNVQLGYVAERQQMTFAIRDADQGIPTVRSEPEGPILDRPEG
ncbi:MAG: hypothetical protein OXH04_00620 [Acidobacteria bacterium]|nr:hypothetical protein [Acidobacteriota bacterium]